MYGDDRQTFKEPLKAADSDTLPAIIDSLGGQKNALAHIRFATVGSIDINNCHPFTGYDISGREWTMIHNGTIYTGGETYKYFKVQRGSTDSERLFLAFIDRMNARLSRGALSERERFTLVNDFIVENSPRNKLNLIFYDGEIMYVHKNFKNTLFSKHTDGGMMFSTVPLDNDGWVPLPMAQVVAYKNGKALYRGQRHKGEFIPNLEYITALDAMHI